MSCVPLRRQMSLFPLSWSCASRLTSVSAAPNAIQVSGKTPNYSLAADMGGSLSRNSDAVSGHPPSSSKAHVPAGRAEAPWLLHGRGYAFPLFPLALPKESTCAHSTYAKDPTNLLKFVGGVGGLVVTDYHDSPVGPYKELVFIPGLYQYHDGTDGKVKKAHGISRIWVDNEKSVTDGRANWGIPKEYGVFEWREPSPSAPGRVTVRRPGEKNRRGSLIFDVVINDRYSPVSLPVLTKVPLLPVNLLDFLPLIQLPLDGDSKRDLPHLLKTCLSASGWVKPAAMAEKPRVDSSLLPAMGTLYGFSITSFEFNFKKPLKL